MTDYSVLLCDIEGTVTSISFVKDTLFPYAHQNVEKFLEKNLDRPDVREVIVRLIQTVADEKATDDNVEFVSPDNLVNGLARNIRYWIEKDKKLTAVKDLQGLIWEDAYTSGEIKAHIYPEVLNYWKKAIENGKKIYIYSSGSVKAQKLLFKHTIEGDLTQYISGYFDTTSGHKQDNASYTKIAGDIGQPVSNILFLTDVEQEARAAQSAGMETLILDRPGNAKLSDAARKDFRVISSLDEI